MLHLFQPIPDGPVVKNRTHSKRRYANLGMTPTIVLNSYRACRSDRLGRGILTSYRNWLITRPAACSWNASSRTSMQMSIVRTCVISSLLRIRVIWGSCSFPGKIVQPLRIISLYSSNRFDIENVLQEFSKFAHQLKNAIDLTYRNFENP